MLASSDSLQVGVILGLAHLPGIDCRAQPDTGMPAADRHDGGVEVPVSLGCPQSACLLCGHLALLDHTVETFQEPPPVLEANFNFKERGHLSPSLLVVDLVDLAQRQVKVLYHGGVSCTSAGRSAVRRGYSDRKDEVQKRLRRVEGQIRGLQRMVEEDVYCIDVLTQVSAATKALQSVALELLGDHLSHCVHDALVEGGDAADEKVREARAAIERLVRS